MICIVSIWWSAPTFEFSKIGATSYWFGATSLWRVLIGTPSLASSQLDLEHVREDALGDRAEVVVVELVALRRLGAEQRAPGRQQVGPFEVVLLVDQEVLLLAADRREDALGVLDRRAARARRSRRRESASIERSSGILWSSASPVHEVKAVGMHSSAPFGFSRMNAGRGRVPGGVAARLERRADAAGRERGGVRLALDQLLAGELGDRGAVAGGRVEGVVLLGRRAGQRLEPVRVVRRALLHRPVLHRLGDRVGERGVERLAAGERALQRLVDVLGQALALDGGGEHVRRRRPGCSGGSGRRTKSEPAIAAELPERIDQLDHCSMTAEQIGLYQAVLDELVLGAGQAEGAAKKGQVLAAITHLKQICNHPAAYRTDDQPLSDRSGKLSRLEEIVEAVFAAGERILIFTHFATWGQRLADHLTDRTGLTIECYHGGLSRGARDRMIEEFQAGTGPGALVLSLKAGGTGLNLTSASHVVLYDRWWNPAVEDQARDRAWRIGQTKTVVCHRLVCPGTVDERVEEVVAGKRQIADLVLPKSSSIADLDAAQLRQALGLTDEMVIMDDPATSGDEAARSRPPRWPMGARHEPPSPTGQQPAFRPAVLGQRQRHRDPITWWSRPRTRPRWWPRSVRRPWASTATRPPTTWRPCTRRQPGWRWPWPRRPTCSSSTTEPDDSPVD